jgi:hypothetical protein
VAGLTNLEKSPMKKEIILSIGLVMAFAAPSFAGDVVSKAQVVIESQSVNPETGKSITQDSLSGHAVKIEFAKDDSTLNLSLDSGQTISMSFVTPRSAEVFKEGMEQIQNNYQIIVPEKPQNRHPGIDAGEIKMKDLKTGNVLPVSSYRVGYALLDAAMTKSFDGVVLNYEARKNELYGDKYGMHLYQRLTDSMNGLGVSSPSGARAEGSVDSDKNVQSAIPEKTKEALLQVGHF